MFRSFPGSWDGFWDCFSQPSRLVIDENPELLGFVLRDRDDELEAMWMLPCPPDGPTLERDR